MIFQNIIKKWISMLKIVLKSERRKKCGCVLTRKSDGGAHSLFLVYSYNLHDPNFNSCHVLRSIFLRYSVTRRRFVHIVVRLRIRRCTRCCFVHLGPRRGRYFFEGLGLAVLEGHTALSGRLCDYEWWRPRGSRAEWERQVLKRQKALLALACLESDDNPSV